MVPRLESDWSIQTPRLEFNPGVLSEEPIRHVGAGRQLLITRAVGKPSQELLFSCDSGAAFQDTHWCDGAVASSRSLQSSWPNKMDAKRGTPQTTFNELSTLCQPLLSSRFF